MRVILTEEVPNVGMPGELVDVAAGYARNYLLPRKLAIAATKGSVKALDHHRRGIESHQKKRAQSAAAVGERVSATPITISAKAGETGRLYGSITSAAIAEEVHRTLGLELDKRKIEIPEPIKVLGDHEVKVRLHRDVQVPLTVTVVAESAPEEAAAPPAEGEPSATEDAAQAPEAAAAEAPAPAPPAEQPPAAAPSAEDDSGAEAGQEPAASAGEQESTPE